MNFLIIQITFQYINFDLLVSFSGYLSKYIELKIKTKLITCTINF